MSQSDVDEQIARREVHGTVNMVAAVAGLYDDRGDFDASVNAYPNAGGSGQGGDILKADIWTVDTGGTFPGSVPATPGDTVRALIDGPGQTPANWKVESGLIKIEEGTGISIDRTDPKRPIISAPGGALPDGGTTGQVLAKVSNDDGDADWADPSGGGGGTSNFYAGVKCATLDPLPACTYENGTLGVGATLTGDANGALADLDGVTPEDGDSVLVGGGDVINGIYVVTQAGDGSNPFILTRRDDCDASAKFVSGAGVIVSLGTLYANTMLYYKSATSPTVGSDTLVFAKAKVTDVIEAIAAGANISVDDTDPANPIVSADISGGLLRYAAVLTQAGTGDPSATVNGVNDIGSIVWTRDDTGYYTGTLNGAFSDKRTEIFMGTLYDHGDGIYLITPLRNSDNSISYRTYTASGLGVVQAEQVGDVSILILVHSV